MIPILLALGAVHDTPVIVVTQTSEEPGIDRTVARNGRAYVEVQAPYPAGIRRTPNGLPVTFRIVRPADAAVRATPDHAVERSYRELEEGDVVLGVGVLPWRPSVVALDDAGAHLAVAAREGVRLLSLSGELVAAFDEADLAQPGGTPVEIALPGRAPGNVGDARRYLPTPPPSFPEHRFALWSEGATFLLARVNPVVHDWRSQEATKALVLLHRLDPATGTVAPIELAELDLPLAAAHVPRGAEILVELAAARGDRDALGAFARRTDVEAGARLRALFYVVDEQPNFARDVAREALAKPEAPHPLVVPYALAVAARCFAPEDAPLLVQLLVESRVAPHDERLLRAALERAEPAATELLLDAVLEGNQNVPAPHHLVSVALTRLDGSGRPELVGRFVDGLDELESTARGRSIVSGLSTGADTLPTLAVANAVRRIRSAMASQEHQYVHGLPRHRAVLGAIADGLEDALSPELEGHWFRQLVDLSDTRTQERTLAAWRDWWSRAQHRPQTAELVAHAKTERYRALRRGLDECLAADDEGHRIAAATALASLERKQLEDAGLVEFAEELLDGWRPLNAAEQAARQRLREVLRGRPGGR